MKSSRLSASATGLTSLLLFATCGDVTGVSADKACTDLAQVQCAKRVSCTNTINVEGVNVLRAFGDVQTCLAREKLACMDGLAAPGTGNSPAMVEKCVDVFPTYACADFIGANPPAECAPTGSRSTGQACVFNGQCASGFCSGNKIAICGACAASPDPSTPCMTSNCGHGQVCVASTMLCQNRGAMDAACDAADPCGVELSCAGPAPTTCKPALTQVGDPCGGANLATCQNDLGLACLGPAGMKVCTSVTFVADKEPCGTLADGSRADCTAGDCYTATAPALASEMGTCKSKVDTGTACDTALGPDCLAPSRCVPTTDGATAGTCTLPLGTAASGCI